MGDSNSLTSLDLYRQRLSRRQLLKGTAAAAISVAVAACAPSAPSPAPTKSGPAAATTPTPAPATAKPGGTAIVAQYAMLQDLDPGRIPAFDAWMAGQNIHEGLVEMQQQSDGSVKINPILAESWDKSSDGNVYTFKLRQGVKFHDGTPFNADAVVFSHDRIMNDKSPYYDKTYVQFHSALTAIIDKVEAADASTVKFTLKQPASPYFLNWEAFHRILSPTAVQKYGAKDIGQHVVGTGPFRLDKFDFTTKVIEMSRNPDYWQKGLPKLDHITWRVVTEPATRFAELDTGSADVATLLATNLADQIKKNAKLVLSVSPVPVFNSVEMYRTVAPFNDLKVRQAVAYGLDRKTLSDILYQGYWKPAINNRWPGLTGWANYAPYPYNPNKAKQLLKEAGKDGMEIAFDMPSASSGNPAGSRWGEVIQEQLGKVGINLKLNVMEGGPFWQSLYTPRANTAYYDTRQVFIGDVVREWLINWAKALPFADKPVQGLPALYDQLQKTSDPTQYSDVVTKIWQVIDDRVPYVAVATGSWLTGYRKALTGLAPAGMGEYLSFKNASLHG